MDGLYGIHRTVVNRAYEMIEKKNFRARLFAVFDKKCEAFRKRPSVRTVLHKYWLQRQDAHTYLEREITWFRLMPLRTVTV